MTILNFALNCTSGQTGNILTFDIGGSPTTEQLANSYVEVYRNSVLIDTLNTLTLTANSFEYEILATICGQNISYFIKLYLVTTLQQTSATLSCTNTCTPPTTTNFDLDCENATSSSISVSWTPLVLTNIFAPYISTKIYRYTTDPLLGGTAVEIASLASNTSSYVDNAVTINTTYWYGIRHINTINASQSSIVTAGPCTIPNNSCQSNIPVTSFPFILSKDCDTSTLYLSGFINSSGAFVIPSELTCYSIASIESVSVKVWEKCCATKPSTSEVLTGNSSNFVANLSSFKWDNLSDGIWSVELTVTYTDNDDVEKTVTTTYCEFIDCSIKCKVASHVAEDPKLNLEAGILLSMIDIASECNSCQTACDLYNHLKLIVNNVCDCS